MLEFQKKKKHKNRLYSKTTLLILLILLGVMVKATWNVFGKERESKVNLERISREAASLESRKSALSASIDQFNTERGREAEIRDKFRVAKAGEQLIVLVDNPANAVESQPEKGWWQKFLDLMSL